MLSLNSAQRVKLRVDCRFGKNKHFSAADRVKRIHLWLGLPVIMISVFIGSAIFTQYLGETEGKVIGAILAFTSALLVSLQTYFNFSKLEEGHRSIGNRYLEISRKCRHLSADLGDGLKKLQEASQVLEKLLEAYNQINNEAESFPTNKRDFKHARRQAEIKVT